MNTIEIQQLIWAFIFCIVTFQSARKMGYSGLLWSFASILYIPLAFIYLLATLPNRQLDKKRKIEMFLLQEQLARRRYSYSSKSVIIPEHTISDERTIN